MVQSRNALFRVLVVPLVFILAACYPTPTVAPPPPTLPPTLAPVTTTTPVPAPLPSQTPTVNVLFLPDIGRHPTATPIKISLPVALQAATPSPTLPWVPVTAGRVSVPILVYHHVTDAELDDRIRVDVGQFQGQMLTLKKQGYHVITITTLAQTMRQGGNLPLKPIVITFDDGYRDVYENAFPFMRSLGFPGVLYVVPSYMEAGDYVYTEQIRDLIDADWEIGSHSMTNQDLTSSAVDPNWEIGQSRRDLQAALEAPINSFAYPFGAVTAQLAKKVSSFGYSSAVCIGATNQQSLDQIYCMPRREVRNNTTLDAFMKMVEEK